MSTSEFTLGESLPFDPTAPLTPSGNLARRTLVNRAIEVTATAAALAAVALLAIVVFGVLTRGAGALSFGFVTQNPVGLVGGGIANYLLGTFIIVAFGAVIALPIAVLTGLYLTEFAGPNSRTARLLTTTLDMMQGVPTIVVGLFVYGLIVIPQHRQSGWAGSIALAIVMLPLMARASQEVLLLVPNSLREAADALGVSRWRTVVSMIVPTAMGGILTGAILATARAAGETAPLLICDSLYSPNTTELNIFGKGVPNVPMLIYTNFDSSIPEAITRLWGAAFVLLVLILIANVIGRVLLARSRAKVMG